MLVNNGPTIIYAPIDPPSHYRPTSGLNLHYWVNIKSYRLTYYSSEFAEWAPSVKRVPLRTMVLAQIMGEEDETELED